MKILKSPPPHSISSHLPRISIGKFVRLTTSSITFNLLLLKFYQLNKCAKVFYLTIKKVYEIKKNICFNNSLFKKTKQSPLAKT